MHSNKILLNMYHAYDGTSILRSPLCLHFHGCNIKGVCTVLQRSIIHNMYDGTIKAIRWPLQGTGCHMEGPDYRGSTVRSQKHFLVLSSDIP